MRVESTRLKSLRLQAKLSQNKLAVKAELDRTTVSNAENGHNVSEITISKLIAALSKELGREISLNSILSGDEDTDDPGPSINRSRWFS